MPCFASSSMSACPLFTLVRVLRIACLPLTLSNVTDNSILLPAFFFPLLLFNLKGCFIFLSFCTSALSLLCFSLLSSLLLRNINNSFANANTHIHFASYRMAPLVVVAMAVVVLVLPPPTLPEPQQHSQQQQRQRFIELKKSNKELLTLANSKTAAAGCKPN